MTAKGSHIDFMFLGHSPLDPPLYNPAYFIGYLSNFQLLQVNADPLDHLEDRVIEGNQDHRVQEVNQVLQDRQGFLVSIRDFPKHTKFALINVIFVFSRICGFSLYLDNLMLVN